MWCEKKAAGQPCPLACSRPRSLNCGVKTPTPMGKNPRSLLQGSEDVHHQGGGGGGGGRGAHSRNWRRIPALLDREGPWGCRKKEKARGQARGGTHWAREVGFSMPKERGAVGH